MFKRLLRAEMRKAFGGVWFAVAISIGCLLALASAAHYLNIYLIEQPFMNLPFLSKKFTTPSSVSAFSYWMVSDAFAPSTNLFFLILPLLAAIPYSWSLLSERASGYAGQIIARSGWVEYLAAKGLAAFLSGGVAVTAPVVLNMVICLCFAPAYTPDVASVSIFGVFEDSLWSWSFYNAPILFFALRTVLLFLFSGLWAAFVMSLSGVLKGRIPLLIVPYLLLVLLKFANEQVIAPIWGFQEDLTPFGYLRTVPPVYFTDGWVIVTEFAAMLAVICIVIACNRRTDAL